MWDIVKEVISTLYEGAWSILRLLAWIMFPWLHLPWAWRVTKMNYQQGELSSRCISSITQVYPLMLSVMIPIGSISCLYALTKHPSDLTLFNTTLTLFSVIVSAHILFVAFFIAPVVLVSYPLIPLSAVWMSLFWIAIHLPDSH